jgi:hypothetical protein
MILCDGIPRPKRDVWRYYWQHGQLRRDNGRGEDEQVLKVKTYPTPELAQYIVDALNEVSLEQAEADSEEFTTYTVDFEAVEQRLVSLLLIDSR